MIVVTAMRSIAHKQLFIQVLTSVENMYRAFRGNWYEKKLKKLSTKEQEIVQQFEQDVKQNPYQGSPLGYTFFREKRINGKRMYYLIYDSHKVVFLITISDKKAQQDVIDVVKANLDVYKEQIEKILKNI